MHVRYYINEGHHVLTAQDFMEAMLSPGGMSGVRVAMVSDTADKSEQEVAGRWEGINDRQFIFQLLKAVGETHQATTLCMSKGDYGILLSYA